MPNSSSEEPKWSRANYAQLLLLILGGLLAGGVWPSESKYAHPAFIAGLVLAFISCGWIVYSLIKKR